MFITFIALCVYLLIFLAASAVRAQNVFYSKRYFEHSIKEGDTLWNIALKYKTDDYDIRKMVYEIKSFNNLDTNYIFPGDIIKIPIKQ